MEFEFLEEKGEEEERGSPLLRLPATADLKLARRQPKVLLLPLPPHWLVVFPYS
jgi:hypothetical protein